MHAVVVRSTVHDLEKAMTFLREETIPRLRQAPGFVAAEWVRLDENTSTSILIFESEAVARAAVEQFSSNPAPAEVLTVTSVEIGEVVERI